MFRQGTETNLKWMLTVSLLFHAAFLSIVFSPNIFNRSDLLTAKYAPFTAIQVSIVNLPNDNPPAMPAPSPAISKTGENIKEDIKSLKKIEKLKEVKSVKAEKTLISEPVKKETIIEKQKESADISEQSTSGADLYGRQQKSEDRRDSPSGMSGEGLVSGPAVDMPSFKYDYYLGLIKNKVDNRWSQPVAHNKTRQALVEFTINRKGEIRNVRVADSSGDNYFDQTALRAVTLSNPFPPLPRGFKGDSLKVNYRFIFSGKS